MGRPLHHVASLTDLIAYTGVLPESEGKTCWVCCGVVGRPWMSLLAPRSRGGPRQTLGGRWAAPGTLPSPSRLWRDGMLPCRHSAMPRLGQSMSPYSSWNVIKNDDNITHFQVEYDGMEQSNR